MLCLREGQEVVSVDVGTIGTSVERAKLKRGRRGACDSIHVLIQVNSYFGSSDEKRRVKVTKSVASKLCSLSNTVESSD